MTAATIRDRLIHYLADANDKKIKELYTILKEHITDIETSPGFTDEQLRILEERKASLASGMDKGLNWQTIHDNIRRKRKNVK